MFPNWPLKTPVHRPLDHPLELHLDRLLCLSRVQLKHLPRGLLLVVLWWGTYALLCFSFSSSFIELAASVK